MRDGFLIVPDLFSKREVRAYKVGIAQVLDEVQREILSAAGDPYQVDTSYTSATGVPAGVKVGFYDGDPNTDGTLLAMTETVNPLPPGGYEEVQIWLPTGSIIADTLYVFADAEDEYRECWEDNNLHHTGIRYRAGDVNGDGCVDDADLLAVLFAFGCSEGCGPEDLNCDGVVDDADLLLVLFNFGSGC